VSRCKYFSHEARGSPENFLLGAGGGVGAENLLISLINLKFVFFCPEYKNVSLKIFVVF
jgi:hypothetical protein